MQTAARKLRISTGETAKKKNIFQYIIYHRYMYLMLLPTIIYYIIFHYVPMFGASIAFKDFNIIKGIIASPWAGLKHFEYLFSLDKFWQVFRNTIVISLYRLMFGFPFPIIMSLLMNEVKNITYKRSIQTVVYLPHFISWVIMGGIVVNLLSADGGVVNEVLYALTGNKINFLTDERLFRGMLVFTMIFKEYGWTTVIYMAALASVDPQLYEAAIINGTNRFQRVWHITLPALRSTIVVMLILRLGNLMQAGFEQIFVLYHPGLYRVADIIDTYVYRIGLTEGRFSLASAVGLFKSVINCVLLVTANKIVRSMNEHGIY